MFIAYTTLIVVFATFTLAIVSPNLDDIMNNPMLICLTLCFSCLIVALAWWLISLAYEGKLYIIKGLY